MRAAGYLGGLTAVAVLAAGCATSRRQALAVQDLKTQVGVLESRVSAIDERQQTMEQQAAERRQETAVAPAPTAVQAAAPRKVKTKAKAKTKTKTKTTAKTSTGATNRGYLYQQPKVSISTKQIQRALKRAGYYTGRIDGIIGPRTRKAVRAFQKANGLTADGIVGQQTWAKLQEHLPSASGSK